VKVIYFIFGDLFLSCIKIKLYSRHKPNKVETVFYKTQSQQGNN